MEQPGKETLDSNHKVQQTPFQEFYVRKVISNFSNLISNDFDPSHCKFQETEIGFETFKSTLGCFNMMFSTLTTSHDTID